MESLIIGIAGGSGSGKSTFTNRIKKRFGDDVVVLYHDNYYRRQDGIPFEQRVTVNYDHPDSLETELLVEHLKLLRQGKLLTVRFTIIPNITVPTRSFISPPSPVILVEESFFWQIPECVSSLILRSMWKLTPMSVSSAGFLVMWKSGEET